MKEHIIIAGGSGFLGQSLAQYLIKQGYEVTILTRKPKMSKEQNLNYLYWDGQTLTDWVKSLEGALAVINMAGRTVNCRYNAKNKAQIYTSRLDSTTAIGRAIQQCETPPKIWMNAASATIYRHALDRPMDEYTGEYGEGFSVDVCQQWEQTFHQIPTPRTRRFILRLAMVLGKNGGVMQPFKNLVRLGLGGTQGKGNQYISWLHEEDFHRIIQWFIDQEQLSGTFNLSAPEPVTNKDFMQKFRKICKQPAGLPANRLMLEIGALVIGTETELILKSRRVVPQKLLDLGFHFKYPNVELALKHLLKGKVVSLPQTSEV